jgi:hypothetical protein
MAVALTENSNRRINAVEEAVENQEEKVKLRREDHK